MTTPIIFPSETSAFSLPLLFAGQAQKEFFINQSISMIDAVLQFAVVSSQPDPASDPAEGSCYRITAPSTGEWSGHEDELAMRIGDAWVFVSPHSGLRVFDRETRSNVYYDSGWHSATEPAVPSGGGVVDSDLRQTVAELIEALRLIGVFPNQT